MKRVGIFGGSFNPIHIGHLQLGKAFFKQASLDELWFVVSPMNPLKKNNYLLEDYHRLKMVEMSIKDYLKTETEPLTIRVSDYEFHLPRPSYMINTLNSIVNDNPTIEPVLLIGEDNWNRFPQWYKADEIVSHFQIYIYPRKKNRDLQPSNHKNEIDCSPYFLHSVPLLDICSTDIRHRIINGENISEMVTPSVEEYIVHYGLYRNLKKFDLL